MLTLFLEALRTPWEKPVSVCAQNPNSPLSLDLGDPQTLEGRESGQAMRLYVQLNFQQLESESLLL